MPVPRRWVVERTFAWLGRNRRLAKDFEVTTESAEDNCQVAVSLSVATSAASLPVAWQLYLPQAWAEDAARREMAKVPETIGFRTKPEIAPGQITLALAEGIAPGVVLADAGYGNSSAFRDGLAELGLEFVVGVSGTATAWPQGITPKVPAGTERGRPPKRLRRGGDDAPVEQVAAMAESLPAEAWRPVTWREGAAEALASRFAALRVRPAQGDHRRGAPRPEQWLLAEWPNDEAGPRKFWFSTVPANTPIERLVFQAKSRWLIERDYLELKPELGLGHYEGRGWPGFHHRGAVCIAAHGFPVAEIAASPPSASETAWLVKALELSAGYKPRGGPNPNRATCAPLDRNTAPPDRARPGAEPAPMPLLRTNHQIAIQSSSPFMTQ